jgi:hypothetical protein
MTTDTIMDNRVTELDNKIGRHMAKRGKYEEQVRRLLRKIDWQTRRIRELSQQRSITLNFNLPGIEP